MTASMGTIWYIILPYGNTSDPHADQEHAAQAIYDALPYDLCVAGGFALEDVWDGEVVTVIEPATRTETVQKYTERVVKELVRMVRKEHALLDAFPVFIGGEHSITYTALNVLRAFGRQQPKLVVFDAHCDDWPADNACEINHGSWINDVMLEDLASYVTNCYVRVVVPNEQRDTDRIFNIFNGAFSPRAEDGPIHLSIDVDVLDPAYVPGVSHPEPFGCAPRELLMQTKAMMRSGAVTSLDINECSTDEQTIKLTAYLLTALLVERASLPDAAGPASA